MMKKLLVLVLLIISMGLASTEAANRVTIEVACIPAWDKVFNEISYRFCRENPDIKVKVTSRGYGEHHNRLIYAIKHQQESPDAAIVDYGYIPTLMSLGYFENLNPAPYNAEQYKNSMAPYKWAQGSSERGELFGFPIDVSPGCAYWRRDVFDAAGVNVDDIKTMDDLYAAAGKIVGGVDGKNGKKYFTSRASDIATMILYSDPKPLAAIDQNGTWVIDVERIRKAYDWARKFKDAGYTSEVGVWTNQWYQGFQQGTVAYEISGSWLGGHLKVWMAPRTSGKWGVARWPALMDGQSPMASNWGGTFMVIPNNAKHKQEAWKFIEFVGTDPKAQLTAYNLQDALPCYMPVWNDPVFEQSVDFYAGQKARILWIEIAKSIPVIATHPYDDKVNEIIFDGLTKVLQNREDIESAIDKVEYEIKQFCVN